MLRLIKMEILYTLKQRYFKITIILSILISLLLAFLFLNGILETKLMDDGSKKVIKGIEASKLTYEYDEKYSGKMTIDKLKTTRDIYQSSYDSIKDKTIISEPFLEVRPIVLSIERLLYPPKDNMIIVKWQGRDMPKEYAEGYYELRSDMIKKNVGSINNINIKNKIISMEENIDKPFSYGENYVNWLDGIEWLTMLMILLLLITNILSSTAFTQPISDGRKSIILKTKTGYKKFSYIKLTSVILINLLIFTISTSIFIFILIKGLGLNGLNTDIQIAMPFSLVNYSFKELIIFILISGAISVISSSAFCMVISAMSNSSKTSISIAIGLFFVFLLNAFFVRTDLPIVKKLFELSSYYMSTSFYYMGTLDLFSISKFVIWKPYALILLSIIKISVFSKAINYVLKRR